MEIKDLPNVPYTLSPKVLARFIGSLLPHYDTLVRRIEKQGGRVSLDPRVAVTLHNFGIENYAEHFADPSALERLTLPGMVGLRKAEEIQALIQESEGQPPAVLLEEQVSRVTSLEFEDVSLFAMSVDEQKRGINDFQELSEEDQLLAKAQIEISWTMFMLHFSNMLAFMCFGKGMDVLIAEAKEGGKPLWSKLLSVDPSVERLLIEFGQEILPQDRGRAVFKSAPRYRKLFMFLALIESFGLKLEKLKPQEILQLADGAGIDRWESRIEGEDHLMKRAAEYRAFQEATSASF